MEWREWLAQAKKSLGSWPSQASPYFTNTWGLSPGFATKAAILYAILTLLGLKPRITSGYRDPDKQRELIRQWNAGQRAGFIGKPADPDSSRHCKESLFGGPASTAIDMPCSDNNLAASIARAMGLRAGVDFNDPGHYDEG